MLNIDRLIGVNLIKCGHMCFERQTKHGVNGNTPGIDCRDAGRRYHNVFLFGAFNEITQKSCLAGARLAGKENATVRVFY